MTHSQINHPKGWGFLLLIGMVLLVGCNTQDYPKPQPIGKQICSNQEVWDNRGSYRDFKCDMYSTPNGTVRDCTASGVEISFEENWTIIKKQLTTICLEVKPNSSHS